MACSKVNFTFVVVKMFRNNYTKDSKWFLLSKYAYVAYIIIIIIIIIIH
jgi:hypothetical protein